MSINLTNIQPHYTIEDDLSHPSIQCHLHILLAPFSITIAIYHPETNKLCSLKKYLFDELVNKEMIETLYNQDIQLQFHYQSYHLDVFSPESYLVSDTETIQQKGILEKDHIHSLHAAIYFNCSIEIISFLNQKAVYQIHSCTANLIETLIKKQQISKNSTIYAHCFDRHIEIIAFENENLLLHNIFSIEQPEDFTYYVLGVYEALRFSTTKIPTVLMGTINKPSRIYDLLFTYIKEVQFSTKNVRINYTTSFDDIEEHIIYPIASLMKL